VAVITVAASRVSHDLSMQICLFSLADDCLCHSDISVYKPTLFQRPLSCHWLCGGSRLSLQNAWHDKLLQCADIGGVRALQLIQKHGNLESVMAQLDTARYGIPDPFPYQEARTLFKGMLS